jgi:hypothetical protein
MREHSHPHMFLASGWLIVVTFSGADGSRSIQKVQVDVSGTGKNFVAAKMVVNGNAVRTVHYIPYPRTYPRPLESYERCYGKAHCPTPSRYQMRWWYQQQPLSCVLHHHCRFRQLCRSLTRCWGIEGSRVTLVPQWSGKGREPFSRFTRCG